MGGACGKETTAVVSSSQPQQDLSKVMFERVDKGSKGYLDLDDLKEMMKDGQAQYFQGKDATHILNKYGSDNKLSYSQFHSYWNSTYTTYNDDNALADLVNQVKAENNMESIPEKDALPTKRVESSEEPINRS